jgi:hypothetical protein
MILRSSEFQEHFTADYKNLFSIKELKVIATNQLVLGLKEEWLKQIFSELFTQSKRITLIFQVFETF